MTEPFPRYRDKPGLAASTPQLTVVGIGASAGGLAALKTFFSRVPADSGVAWVVVVHLSPKHESRLSELLQPHVGVRVRQVSETTALEPDQIYVIPPNANLNAVDTHLRLSELEVPAGQRAPVDHFFRTLATTHDGHSVGVILTGTGSDGAQGIREIKAKGGLTLVQDPQEAEYDGMPRSAIATGEVDAVLPVAELAGAVLRFVRTEPRIPVAAEESAVEGDRWRLIQKVFALIRSRTGRDFNRYKRPTVLRRLARRMQLRHVEELEEYLELLRSDPAELEALADDVLVTVTSFFRDPEVFEALKTHVVPRLFEGKGPADSIRVWVVGCATGEEAYSLAMLLLEEAASYHAPPRLQVFATDLHEPSLERARAGFYAGDIEGDVSPERLQRFFQAENGGYRVRKAVRELVLFSPHDLLGDPPFSRLDLISCRNVLIYLQREVQREVLNLFHYCITEKGSLVLGTSEAPDTSDLFRAEDKEHRIYRRRRGHTSDVALPVFPFSRHRDQFRASAPHAEPDVAPAQLHRQMVERYAPPSLLVDADDRVIHLSEQAGHYLVHPAGELTSNLFRIVHEELRMELRAVLHRARRGAGHGVRSNPIRLTLKGSDVTVVLSVHPVPRPEQNGWALIVFDEYAPEPGDEAGAAVRERATDGERVADLEAQLAAAENRLQAIVDDYEAGRQQLRASNEELQSSNQELRATLEELETSKEELQSINEELQAVNQENRHKVEELAQLSGDLQNLLVATDIATLFLDRKLRILRFTPKLAELFNVRAADHGRPISDLTNRLGYGSLLDDARTVLERLTGVEREVRDELGRWYITRVLPYRSAEDRIEGVVITFVDITDRKRLEEESHKARIFAESIIETLDDPLVVLESDLRVRTANPAFYEHFHVQPEETVGRVFFQLGNGQWDIPELRTLLEAVLPESHVITDFEVEHEFESIGHRVILVTARQLDHVQLVLLGIRDITEQRHAEQELESAKDAAERASGVKSQFLSTMSHELRTPLTAVIGLADLLESEILGPATAAQKEHLARIRRSAWHLVGIIDEILTFARSEAGSEQVTITDADLARVARDVIDTLAGSLIDTDIELRLSGADEALPATTDAGKVRQILTNLVGNAIKYGDDAVEVELQATDHWVELRVRDHGPGIAPDQHEAIFAPFTQVDSSNTRSTGGTGLGLTICRRLSRLLGGDVTVHSTVGVGSTFTLRLPRNAADPSVDVEGGGSLPDVSVPRSPFSAPKVPGMTAVPAARRSSKVHDSSAAGRP